jgi:hypothetical protein
MNRDLIQAIWRRHREPLNTPSTVQQPSHEDAGSKRGGPDLQKRSILSNEPSGVNRSLTISEATSV